MQVIRKTIGDMLAEIAAAYPLHDALIYTETDVRYNFQQFIQAIDQSARGYLAAGIKPKDKVALWARNTPEWLLSFLGLIQIGAIAVPIDPNATQENLFFILEQSESRGLIIPGGPDDQRFLEMALTAKGKLDDSLRLFLGHAGWKSGQLEDELAEGDWHLLSVQPELLLQEGSQMWVAAIREVGRAFYQDVLGISGVPDDPQAN